MKPFVKSFVFWFVILLMSIPAVLFAQEAPTFTDITQQGIVAIQTWKSVGYLAGMLAVVNVLVNATKLPFLSDFFSQRVWLRPLLATIFGALAGTLQAMVEGSPFLPSLLVGLIAGLGSVGFHELMQILNQRKQTERKIGGLIVESVGDSQKVTKDLTQKIHEIDAISGETHRLQALADLANNS